MTARENECNALELLDFEFEGRPLTVVYYKGVPHWIGRELGAVLGYARGGERLVTKITSGDWSEFERGRDFILVDGEALRELKRCSLPTDAVGRHARHVVLLSETGLHLALLKADHRLSVRMRRFLASEVMPQLARAGSYEPGRTVEGDRAVDRDRPVGAQVPRCDLDKAAARQRLWTQLWRSRRIANHHLADLAIEAAELETGLDLSAYRPPAPAPSASTCARRFVTECCLAEGRTRTMELYARYEQWAAREGIAAQSNIRFGRELTRMGLRAQKSGCRFYPVRLREVSQ